jgi:TetR/AcrR family transcriptional regulator, transcriptional repressor for nem operon
LLRLGSAQAKRQPFRVAKVCGKANDAGPACARGISKLTALEVTSHIGLVGRTSAKAQIIEAGMAEMHARGYAACSVEQITRTAGVPKGSFYNHFSSKEELAVVVARRYFDVCGWPVGLEGGSAITRLRASFEALHGVLRGYWFSRGCVWGNLANELADHSDAVRGELAEGLAGWSGMVAVMVAEAQQNGETAAAGDPQVLGRFIVNSWEGAVTRCRVVRSDQPIDDFFVTIFGFLLG